MCTGPFLRGIFFSVCNFYFQIWHIFKLLINNWQWSNCLLSIRACATFNKGNKLLFSLFFLQQYALSLVTSRSHDIEQ